MDILDDRESIALSAELLIVWSRRSEWRFEYHIGSKDVWEKGGGEGAEDDK